MDSFRGKIRDISAMGLGVVDHPEGRAFFVQGGWPGDEGVFEIESVRKKYGFARLVQVEKLSEDREANPCRHSGTLPGRCGGCPWLGIKYERQLAQKQKMIEYLNSRNDPDSGTVIEKIWPSSKALGYRNRAQLKTDGEELGFVSPGSKILAPVEDCLVLSDANRQTLKTLRRQLPNPAWRPHPPYLWNFFDINEDTPAAQMIPNRRAVFRQGNTEQNLKMRGWLREKLAALDKDQAVLELFSGSGNFTKVIAAAGFKKITATEFDPQAVDRLTARKLPGVRAVAADLFKPQNWPSLLKIASDSEILVLDPPREGFPGIENFVSGLPHLNRIFYISCEASRFFTEGRALKAAGWKLRQIQPVDQFPQTPYIELLAEFDRSFALEKAK